MSIMSMQERSQGLGTKIIIGLIIVAFAFFGLGSITTFLAPVPKVATINGVDITQVEMENAVSRSRRMQQDNGVSPEELDEDLLRQNVLKTLVNRELLNQSTETLELTIADSVLDADITVTEVFQVNGRFDPDQFRVVLAGAGYNPARYREELRQDKAIQQLSDGLRSTAFVTDTEVRQAASLMQQTRDIAYLEFTSVMMTEAANVSEIEVADYYDQNQASFYSPESVDIEYVELTRANLMDQVEISDEALQTFYTNRADLFSQPERRRLSHILIATEGDDSASALEAIEGIRARLDTGESFSELAQALSQDPGSAAQGGDLGYLSPDVFVKPFESAALALTVTGEVSVPVETQFGYHLLQLTELAEQVVPDLETIKAEVTLAFKEEAVAEEYVTQVSIMDELAFEDPDLLGISQQLDLEIKSSGLLERVSSTGLFANGAVKEAVFSPDLLIDGNNSSLIEESDNRALIVRVKAHRPSELRELVNVRDEIVAQLKENKASELAEQQAQKAVSMLEQGDITRYVADQFGLEWKVVPKAQRYQQGLPQAIRTKAFSLAKPDSSSKSVGYTLTDGGGAAVISVTNVAAKQVDAIMDEEVQGLGQVMAMQLGGFDMQNYQSSRKQEADITGS
ncbi:MAG: hypothetical protein HOJ61_05645 [Gammaproteobacteria bacterium]|nr:hypothetical protein [Gammaproteobacteria bacterium]MBT5601702.1 hypothetical protein [Gammaproteobacteria bacterium]MBT6245235.1 hypothetical protein [Gammaproteobacteria bacterium]